MITPESQSGEVPPPSETKEGWSAANPFLIALLPLIGGCVVTNVRASGLNGGADVEVLWGGTLLTMTATFLTTVLLGVLFRRRVRKHWGLATWLLLITVLGPLYLTAELLDPIINPVIMGPILIPYPPLPVDSITYRRDSLQLVAAATDWTAVDSMRFDAEIIRNVWVERIIYRPGGDRLFVIVVMHKHYEQSTGPRDLYIVETMLADRIIGNTLDIWYSPKGTEGFGGVDTTRLEATRSILKRYFGAYDFYGNTNLPAIWEQSTIFARETPYSQFDRERLESSREETRRRILDSLAETGAGSPDSSRQ